ncbi:unnamed protein product [Diamesa hyperborea]
MKHQQVKVDYFEMLTSGVTIVALIACGWVLLKLIQAIFWLPSYLTSCKQVEEKIEKLDKTGEMVEETEELFDEQKKGDEEVVVEDVPKGVKKDN